MPVESPRRPAAGSRAAEAAGAAPAPSSPEGPSFEAAIGELEAIVQQMESGELSLEQSLAAYRRGAELLGACRERLAAVRQQVRVLEDDVLRPFDADASGAPGAGPDA